VRAQDYVAHLKHHLNQILGQTFATNYGKGSSSEPLHLGRANRQ